VRLGRRRRGVLESDRAQITRLRGEAENFRTHPDRDAPVHDESFISTEFQPCARRPDRACSSKATVVGDGTAIEELNRHGGRTGLDRRLQAQRFAR